MIDKACFQWTAAPPPRSPASCATSGRTGPGSSGRTSTRSSGGSTSPSGSWPRRSGRSICASAAATAVVRPRPVVRGCGRGGRGVLVGFGLDAARRADGEKHLCLARPAVARVRPGDPDARRDPRRGARHARPMGRHGAVADRPVGALEGFGADQADARQQRRGRVGLFARRLRDRRRPRRRGRLCGPARSGLGSAASGWRATWCPTTWASIRAGSSSTRSGSCRCRSRPTRPTRTPAPTCRRTRGSGSSSRTTTGTTATRRSSSSGSTARPATSATSITGTTGRASRGTTRPSSTSSTRPSASRSSGSSSTSPAASRSSASMPRWSSPRSTSSGCGGRSRAPAAAIPSRAEHAIPKAEFDRRMPNEFWREVVDRVAAEVPGTLLLAEAFWLLEGYFVRTLGMHRVYNSAFMHMLRDEDGAGYRKVIKETIEFDPEILKRYVNFMSNPDEKTALEQFGKGDKYFGVATVLATLPGLPMLGHGQIAGLRREVRDGIPPGDARRAARSVAPRAPRTRDLPAPPSSGVVRRGGRLPAVRPGDSRRDRRRVGHRLLERLGSRTLAGHLPHALRVDERPDPRVGELRPEGGRRDQAPGPHHARRGARSPERAGRVRHLPRRAERPRVHPVVSRDLGERARGHARRLRDQRLLGVPRGLGRGRGAVGASRRTARRRRGPVARGRLPAAPARTRPSAVPGDLRRRPDGRGAWTASRRGRSSRELERRFAAFLRAIAAATGVDGDPAPIAAELRDRAERAFVGMAISEEDADFATVAAALAAGTPLDPEDIEHDPERRHGLDRRDRAALLAWMALSHTGALAPAPTSPRPAWPGTTSCGSRRRSSAGSTTPGSARARRGPSPTRSGSCSPLPRPSAMRGSARVAAGRLFDAWLALELTRVAIGVNTWEGVEYLDRDRFLALLAWAVRLDAIDAADAKTAALERTDRDPSGRSRRDGGLSRGRRRGPLWPSRPEACSAARPARPPRARRRRS